MIVPSSPTPAGQDASVQIAEGGRLLKLDYAGLEAWHRDGAWWGCSVGFRVMQVAGAVLTHQRPWDRECLYVVSGHPGPGVRDAIEYVTGCMRRGRFRLLDAVAGQSGCGPEMVYAWWVSDGRRTVAVRLHEDFVPPGFRELLARAGTAQERAEDPRRLAEGKDALRERIWKEPLSRSFLTSLGPPLEPDALPLDAG